MEGSKIKYTVYLAGAIEFEDSPSDWRNEIKSKLSSHDICFYDPVEREEQKTGKNAKEQVKYITGLKRSGNFEIFMKEMNKIWLGSLSPRRHELLDTFKFLRIRKQIDGNELRDFYFWGDWEAVIRSDFIIALIKKNVNTIGTIAEIVVATIFQIPVYLILDHPKTEANSSLLYFVLYSGGDIVYTINDCVELIKNKYKINI